MSLKRSKPLKRGEGPRRSSPEAIRAWQRRSKPLKVKSARQRRVDRAREDVVRPAVIARDGERCYAGAHGLLAEVRCASPFPDRRALEMHEVIKRSLWRAGALEPDNCRLLCQAHHDATETMIERATEDGLLASALPVDGPSRVR